MCCGFYRKKSYDTRVVYSESVIAKLASLAHCRELPNANAEGIGINLVCGSSVRFFLCVQESGRVADAAFRSNGCGYSRTGADILAEWVTDKQLVDLHGLADAELICYIRSELGEIPDGNSACIAAATSALKDAFADRRSRQIQEFRSGEALICTCFGVTEERIEDLVAKSQLTSIDQITAVCNAGGGCGSCRMLIQEMLDSVL